MARETNSERLDRLERLAARAQRSKPAHLRFVEELVDTIGPNGRPLANFHERIEVHDMHIATQRGPLGGISTRLPITWIDEFGRSHFIMVQVYSDGNIDDAFERMGIDV
jgi:hypothetical protein